MDNIKQKEMEKLIIEAPLGKQDKDFLIKLFNDNGESVDFYEKFNELLIKELKRKEIAYADVIRKFDNEEEIINKKYWGRKDQIEKELSSKLRVIDPFQIEEGNVILDHYYQQIDVIREDYKNSVMKLATQLTISLI